MGRERTIAYIRRRPILSGFVIFTSAFTMGLLVTGWLLVYERSHRMPVAPPIAKVLAKLDSGDFEAARDLAARVFAHGKQTDEERGAALYIIGAVTFHDAETHEMEREKPRMYLLAARYLEEARDYGLPASHKLDGIETLAQCYFNVDRYAKALPIACGLLWRKKQKTARTCSGCCERPTCAMRNPQAKKPSKRTRNSSPNPI